MSMTTSRFFHLSTTGAALSRLQEAEQFYLAGNLNEALAAAQQAWREHPKDPDVFRVLAYIHMARGEYAPSAQAAYQSVMLDGENPASYAILTQVYLTFNLLANADETLVIARKLFARDSSILVLQSDLLFRKNQTYSAEQYALQALEQTPDNAYAQALLGTSYFRKKRYRDAIKYLQPAIHAYPSRWDYLRDLGAALLYTGDYPEARSVLLSSYRLNQNDLSTKHHLFLALRLTSMQPGIWPMVLFFYARHGFAAFVFLLGSLFTMVSTIWLSMTKMEVLLSFTGFILVLMALTGITMIVFTIQSLLLRQRKGKKFDLYIWRAAENFAQATIAPPKGS